MKIILEKCLAFTLIELLIVVAIIGILVSLAFPVINQVRESAKIAAARADMQSIVTATEDYYTSYRKLPLPGVFQGRGSAHRSWDGSAYGIGKISKQYQNPPGVNDKRLQVGFEPKAGEVQETPDLKLYRIAIATMQGSNKYSLNPRETKFLELQEGRPHGSYLDPWCHGITLVDHPENRTYQIWFDHNFNGFITVGSLGNQPIENHLAVLRCLGANRKAETYKEITQQKVKVYDIYSFKQDVFLDELQ